MFSIDLSSDGELVRFIREGGVVGDMEIGRVGGEWEEARGLGLELRLRGPLLSTLPVPLLPMPGHSEPERLAFEPGVTASKAEPRLPGRV